MWDAAKRKRIGLRLKALRIEQELDQIEVARLAKISPGTVQTIEWGARESREINIDRLARALGTSLEALERKGPEGNPLVKGLNREDLEVARAHHEASSLVRHHARTVLRERDPQAPLGLTPDEITALAHRIARLKGPERRQLVIDLLQQLEQVDAQDDKAS